MKCVIIIQFTIIQSYLVKHRYFYSGIIILFNNIIVLIILFTWIFRFAGKFDILINRKYDIIFRFCG